MKRSEMNTHQLLAFEFICYAMSELIAGYELSLQDYPEGSEEYEEAKAYLGRGKEALKNDVYEEVMALADKGTAKHLRFAGKDFIMERIDRRLTKWGY